MGVSFPRISITVDNGNERGTQGELGTLAFGFGIHLTWSFCILFNPTILFSNDVLGTTSTFPFFATALAALALFGLFLFVTDQRFLRYYTSRNTLIISAAVCAIGSLSAFATHAVQDTLPIFTIAGVLVGCGTGLLTVLWGTAFSRYNTASIVLNTSVAVVIATLLYSLIIHILPWPYGGVLVSLFPFLELPLLWKLTPISYALRHEVPIFNALPIKKGVFMLLFSVPILLFGIVLGTLKNICLTLILPSANPTVQLVALFAGGTATIVLLVLAFSTDKHYRWDFLFRPLVPVIGIATLFAPWLLTSVDLLPSLMMLIGFLCTEALMWILLGQLAQEFRLSPICMFGMGSFSISIGTFIGSCLPHLGMQLDALPYGTGSLVVILLLSLMIGVSLLPRIQDLRRFIAPSSTKDIDHLEAFNKQIDRAQARLRASKPPAWSVGIDASAAIDPYFAIATASVEQPSMRYDAETAIWSGEEPDEKPESLPKDQESDEARAKVRGRFRTQCEEIANRYLLSRRETEVMFLLAKGHNAAFIQEKLCISKSTAKTHISHIYRKLDIHNQQELLAMVDAARNEQ